MYRIYEPVNGKLELVATSNEHATARIFMRNPRYTVIHGL